MFSSFFIIKDFLLPAKNILLKEKQTMRYCTIEDVRTIVPKSIIIGPQLTDGVNVLESTVLYLIEEQAGIIDAHLSALYRTPLVKYKEPDYSQNPVSFAELFPPPLVMLNARFAAAHMFEKLAMSQQEPDVTEWGKNNRALAFDDLKMIQAGTIQLKGQERVGLRFVRQEVMDPSRVPSRESIQPPQRQAGQ
jgi:hypothetical protein